MSSQTIASRVRRGLLETVFRLLYTRLGFLHEPVGRAVFGAAWDQRRLHVLSGELSGPLLDLGCGEGRLLSSITAHNVFALGIEPSPAMTRRARRRGIRVIRATAQSLPIRDAAIQRVIATYPGPWIIDPHTWDEIARVTVSGATVCVLLGGDITRGRGARVRNWLIRVAYGSGGGTFGQLPPLGNDRVTGDYSLVDDEWGQAIVWLGVRTGERNDAPG